MCGGGSRVESASGGVHPDGETSRRGRGNPPGGTRGAVYARLSVVLALLSPALLFSAALSPSWLAVREIFRPAVYDVVMTNAGSSGTSRLDWHSGWASYDIGLWRACLNTADPSEAALIETSAEAAPTATPSPVVTRSNHDSESSVFCASMMKGLVNYVHEKDTNKIHLEGVPLILSKTGWAVHMIGMSLIQLVGAVLSAIVGHCRQSNLGFFATYFSAMGGMLTGGGLLNIAAVVAEARALPTPIPTWHRSPLSSESDIDSNPAVIVSYGWPFYAAVIVFFIANFNVYFLARAALSRYESVEAMVRAVVPGADRKLREHHDSVLWQVFPGSQRARQLGCIPFGGGGGQGGGSGSTSGEAIECSNDAASASPQLIVKAKPDICSGSDGGAAASDDLLLGEALEIKSVQRPISPFNDTASGPCMPNATCGPVGSSLPNPHHHPHPRPPGAVDSSAFAGVSVPITLMRPRPHQRMSHRTIPCNVLEDATALDSFPPFPNEPSSVTSPSAASVTPPPMTTQLGLQMTTGGGTLQPTRHKSAGAGAGAGAGVVVPRIPVAHTHTLPHPPRQF